MTLKLIESSKKKTWMRDGKFVKEANIPSGEMKLYKNQCMMCDDHADHKRVVDGMTVGICDTHYYSTTYGALTAQVRKEFSNGNEDTPSRGETERSDSPQGYSQG